MKHYFMLLAMLCLFACQRTMDPWTTEEDRLDVPMYVRTRSLSGITPTPTTYQFFIMNKETGTFTRYEVNTGTTNQSQMSLKLLPGDYAGYCVTGATEEDNWIFQEDSPPDSIYLKIQKNNSSHEEAKDHLLGYKTFHVSETNDSAVIFDLMRKVGMLKVRIENIPDWVNDLQINLSNIPKQMSLTGVYSDDTYTVVKDITLPENGISETDILIFPPKTEKATLTLSSSSLVFITPEHTIDSILPNRITQINAIFQEAATSYQVDISSQLVDWEDPIIQEQDWQVDLPLPLCTGDGNGIELATNGNFEEGFTDSIPLGWKLDVSDNKYPKKASAVTNPIHSGEKAVMIEGKTYIYQDIAITEGVCYQLHLYINAPQENARWKCYSTWYNGSDKLTSDQIQSDKYEGQTEGYIDFYQGKLFRAPQKANKLRIEIRNYNDPGSSGGIYIDAVSVQAVE